MSLHLSQTPFVFHYTDSPLRDLDFNRCYAYLRVSPVMEDYLRRGEKDPVFRKTWVEIFEQRKNKDSN